MNLTPHEQLEKKVNRCIGDVDALIQDVARLRDLVKATCNYRDHEISRLTDEVFTLGEDFEDFRRELKLPGAEE